MINSKNLLFAVIAGLASAVLAALALTRPGLLTMLIYVASVPVFFASFAWGSIAGIIAAIVAALATGMAGQIQVVAIVGLTIVGPAAYAGHLAGLSREGEDGKKYWFPLSEILFRLALVVAAVYIGLGLWAGYDVEQVASQIEHMMVQVLAASGDAVTNEEQIKENSLLYATMLPMVVPPFSLAVLVWNMNIAARMARKRAKFARPKDNIAADSGLPRTALMLFAAGLVVALLVPSLQSMALVVVGTMAMAISMIGMAVMHYYTWGLRARSQILFFAYVLTATTSIPMVLFLIVGMVELLFFLRARDPNRMPPVINTPNNT